MKFQDKQTNKSSKTYMFLFLIFTLIGIFLLLKVKINLFSYSGDLNYIDTQRLKILSLNYLKDQPLFWINKFEFESALKAEIPQVREVHYKILNTGHLEIIIVAEDICCVIKDINDKSFVVSKTGIVLRDFYGSLNSEFQILSQKELSLNQKLNLGLIKTLVSIINKEINLNELKDNTLYLEQDLIFFYTSDSKQIWFNQNTDFKKFNENLKNMKSYLEQNQKNYSILDFRFEKIVVK